MPSYVSGVHIPRNPSRPSSSMASRAKWAVRSHSAANGSIRVRPTSRASSTIWRCVSERPAGSIAIAIETPAALAAQPPRRNQLPQQRCRAVFVVAEIAMQHLEDREADVEPDQVSEGERSERMVHAELHHGVHRLGR